MNLKPILRLAVALVMVILGAGLFVFQQKRTKEIERMISESDGSVPLSPDELAAKHSKIEAAANQVVEALNAHRADAAWAIWNPIRSDVDNIVYSAGSNQEIVPGIRASDWEQQIRKRIVAAARVELDDLLARAGRSEVEIETLETFISRWDILSSDSLRKNRAQQLEQLDLARARLAANTVRIEFESGKPEWIDKARPQLQSRFGNQPVMRIAYGRPAGNLERAASWQIFDVKLLLENAQYTFARRDVYRTPPAIPWKLHVSIVPRKKTQSRSTWDAIEGKSFEVEVPETLSVSKSTTPNAEEDYVTEWQNKNAAKLGEFLDGWLAGLPAFAIMPHNPEQPATAQSLIKGPDTLDFAAAEALALNDSAAFLRELPALLAGARTHPMHAAVRQLLISRNVGPPYDAWVSKSLLVSNEESQQATVEILVERPWYGNFEPLITLLGSAKGVVVASRAQSAVSGFAAELPVRNAFVRFVQQPKLIAAHPVAPGDTRPPQPMLNRGDFATALIHSAPLEKRADFAPWLRDKDEEFVTRVFLAYQNTDADLAMRLAREHFQHVPPSLQATLLKGLQLAAESATPGDLALIATAAQHAPDPNTRSQALSSLMDACYKPDVWDALASIPPEYLPNPQSAPFVLQRLVGNVRRARPELADAWIHEKLLFVQKNAVPSAVADPAAAARNKELANLYAGIRHGLMHEWLTVPGKTSERMDVFLDLSRRDAALLASAAQAIRQYKEARELVWDWGQPAIEEILTRALVSPDKGARWAATEAAIFALNKGEQTKFAAPLQNSLASETDPQIRQMLEKGLKSNAGPPK